MRAPLLVFLLLVAVAFSHIAADQMTGEDRSPRVRRGHYRVVRCDPPCDTGGHVPTCCRSHGYRGGHCAGGAYCHT